MRKNKRGRSRRGGYWFYPGPGDDEHAFTKLRNKFTSGNWKFWQKQPEAVPDYMTAEAAPVVAEQEQPSGSLEYPAPEPNQPEQIENQEAPMEPSPPMENQEAPMMEENSVVPEPAPVEEPTPETSETPPAITGGRRRRQKRATKKRKRSNMRRRTNKRRRSSKRRR